MNARPDPHFGKPPYHAETVNSDGWSGVFNGDGFNCLRFTNNPGAVFTTPERAAILASEWNKNEQ